MIYSSCKLFWAVVLIFLKCVVTYLSWVCCHSPFHFECVINLITGRLGSSFLCKWPNYTSIKLFFSITAQPQLLEVRSPGDVDIVSRTLLYLAFLFDLFFSFLSFLWLLYFCENWIELNCLPLLLHLNTKPQISLYISILGSLQSCIILSLLDYHPRVNKVVSEQKLSFNCFIYGIFCPRGLLWCMWKNPQV
jgi:hypothetical protein